jgi:hypothetical protein
LTCDTTYHAFLGVAIKFWLAYFYDPGFITKSSLLPPPPYKNKQDIHMYPLEPDACTNL